MLWKSFQSYSNEVLKHSVVAALIVATVIVVVQRRDMRVLAGHIGVTAYPNGIAVVQVPYRRDGEAGTVTAHIGGQAAVDAMPALAVKLDNDNFFFRPVEALGERVLVSVAYDSGGKVEMTDKLVKVVHARANDDGNAADESAPRAAADAAVAIAKAHNGDEKLPADPLTIVGELKGDMRWTGTGVTPENFVSGLNLWAKKKGLPVITEKIVGKPVVMLDEISRALSDRGTAQIYLKFNRIGRTVGISRVIRTGTDVFIGVHDSAGPAGTDVYRVRNGVLVDYAFSDDIAVIGWGFVQTWNNK